MWITISFKSNLIIFLTLVFISYVVDITRNKCDNLCFAAKINNLLHHFLSTYLYFGSIVIGYHEFHILYILMGIINLPSDIIRYYQYFKSLMNYKRAEKEIQMLKEELGKYEQKNLVK